MGIFDRVLKEYGYLLEADGDDNSTDNNTDTNADNTNDDAGDTSTDNGDSNNDDQSNDSDDDFDIDTSLDDDTSDEGSDDSTGDDTDTGDTDSSGSTDTGTDEPVPQNKEIFDTLSAEEQAIKIKELKKQYQSLYNAIDENITRLNDIEVNDEYLIQVSRISGFLYDLKNSMYEYYLNSFDNKSFYDNDVMYNRFLAMVHYIAGIIEVIAKSEEKELEENKK